MNRVEFMGKIKEVLECEQQLNEGIVLESLEEWDSLAFISMLSLYDEHFEKMISSDELESCKTVGDLINLVDEFLDK